MKALIVGANGQVGQALQTKAPADAQIVAYGSDQLDITDSAAVHAAVQEVQPQILFNAAAYTAVDKAESESERAFAVNGAAVGILTGAARAAGAQFVHISTDFVFDGKSGVPYPPHAPTVPLGVYGASKLEGERQAGTDALIVRTAWVYAASGRNFVATMLRLMQSHPEVRVVADQIGTPTFAPNLAGALWELAGQRARGLYHYTDSGVASWYDFAVAVQEEALALGMLDHEVPVVPIATAQFPTPAERPSYSVLDKADTWTKLGRPAPHWRVGLRDMLTELKNNG